MNFSSTSNIGVQRCLYPLFQNQRPHFLLPPLFWIISQPSSQDQLNGKRTYYHDHPFPSELASQIQSLIFLWTPRGFSLQNTSWIFSQTCISHQLYPTMVAEKFQIYNVKITGRYICETKNWISSFLLMSPSKTLY